MNKKMQTMTQENTDKNLYAPFLFMSLWTDMNRWQEVQARRSDANVSLVSLWQVCAG